MHAKYKALIILGTLALILGGIALYRKPAIAPVIINHQENNQSTSTVGSELKDWQTYSDGLITFQYPSQYRVVTNQTVRIIDPKAPDANLLILEIENIKVDNSAGNLDQTAKNLYGKSYMEKVKVLPSGIIVKVDDLPSYRFIASNGKTGIEASAPGCDFSGESYCEGIIDTLEFVNSQPDTTEWKVYKNEEYGFELKFPPRWSTMQVRENGFSFYLKLEDSEEYDSVCGIKMYKEDNWYKLINDYNEPHPSADEYLGTDENGWVYAYTCGQDDYGFAGFENYNEKIRKTGYYGGGQGPYYDFRKLIVPTFKFIN